MQLTIHATDLVVHSMREKSVGFEMQTAIIVGRDALRVYVGPV